MSYNLLMSGKLPDDPIQTVYNELLISIGNNPDSPLLSEMRDIADTYDRLRTPPPNQLAVARQYREVTTAFQRIRTKTELSHEIAFLDKLIAFADESATRAENGFNNLGRNNYFNYNHNVANSQYSIPPNVKQNNGVAPKSRKNRRKSRKNRRK